jgi:hypothetical protein
LQQPHSSFRERPHFSRLRELAKEDEQKDTRLMNFLNRQEEPSAAVIVPLRMAYDVDDAPPPAVFDQLLYRMTNKYAAKTDAPQDRNR